MKKTLLSITLLAASHALSAQSSYIAIPYNDNPWLAGIAMSSNGEHVGGMDYSLNMFVAKWADLTVVQPEDEPGDMGCCVRCISNTGVGVGFNDNYAVTFDMTGKTTILDNAEEEGGGAIAEAITADGKFICGEVGTGKLAKAGYWNEEGKFVMLPQPTTEETGLKILGASATKVNTDGSLIAGYISDKLSTRPLILWRRGADGTYTVDPVFKKYCKDKTSDGLGLMCYFTPTDMSENGKWVAVTVSTDAGDLKMARYDVENDKLEVIDYPQIEDGNFCYSSAIANDGTVLGYTSDDESTYRIALIAKAGETVAKSFGVEFSGISDLVEFETLGFNTPCDMTPDGKYIAGYGMYIDEELDMQVFITYRIDTENYTASVDRVVAPMADGKTACFSVNGTRVNPDTFRGLQIVKGADGKVRKVLKK